MIDQQTGYLHFTDTVSIGPGTSTDTLMHLFRLYMDSKQDHGNGYSTIIIRNIPIDRLYYNFSFSCFEGRLCSIRFIMGKLPFDPLSGWDKWPEKEDGLNPEEFKQWLQDELGPQHTFTWGTVSANIDPKGGGNAIGIHYNNEIRGNSK